MTLDDKLVHAFRMVESILRHDDETPEARTAAMDRLAAKIKEETAAMLARETPALAERRAALTEAWKGQRLFEAARKRLRGSK